MTSEKLKSKDLVKALESYLLGDFSATDFLLPIVSSKKSNLQKIKKTFDGSSFLLKNVSIEKIENNCYALIIKGKKQDD